MNLCSLLATVCFSIAHGSLIAVVLVVVVLVVVVLVMVMVMVVLAVVGWGGDKRKMCSLLL